MARVQINLRCTEELLEQIDRAATAAGLSRTEFMLKACRQAADKIKAAGPPPPSGTGQLAPTIDDRPAQAEHQLPRRVSRDAARKAAKRPHSVATANRSAAGSKPLERRSVDPIPKAPKGKR